MDEEQRHLKTQWKQAQRELARDAFPLAEGELASMFEMVNVHVEKDGCDHSLRATVAWLGQRPETEAVIAWLEDNGGLCDCEVIANAEDHFERNRS